MYEIQSHNCVPETWIVQGPTLNFCVVCLCFCINPRYSSSPVRVVGGVLTLCHCPREWISIHLAHRSLWFFATWFLLTEKEFSLKHPSLIHSLWYNEVCSHYYSSCIIQLQLSQDHSCRSSPSVLSPTAVFLSVCVSPTPSLPLLLPTALFSLHPQLCLLLCTLGVP